MLRTTFAVSTLLAVAGATSVAADIPRHGSPDIRLPTHGVSYTPGIRIWTSGSDLHRRGDRVRLYYRTERDAYVTIFRVDTDGRIDVLFPRNPEDENYGSAGATYSVANYDRSSAFQVDDDPGVGYVFGVASVDPFDYGRIMNGGRWDLRDLSDGRIHGDPRSAMEEMVQNLMPSGYGDFDTHLLPYYVDRRFDYPRFVCYDCHAHVPIIYWDPYSAWCRRYTLTVFNDPYYYYPSYWYPTTYYGGRRVVYAQPNGSRYVFKTRDNASPGIDYRDRRNNPGAPAATANRTPEPRGVRGSDIGGVGTVPAPRGGRREAPPMTGGGGIGGGEQPRDRNTSDEPRPTGNDNEPRRRDGGTPAEGSQQPGTTAPDAGGRRRVDGQPGIQIVPRTETTPPSSGGRRDGGYGNEPRPARPAPREREAQPRPDARPQPATRDARPEARQPEARQPEARQPESRQPEARQPESRQPESRQPETRQPERQPESRPQASPPRESRPAERQPESRPQSRPESAPPKSNDPGLVRRRP